MSRLVVQRVLSVVCCLLCELDSKHLAKAKQQQDAKQQDAKQQEAKTREKGRRQQLTLHKCNPEQPAARQTHSKRHTQGCEPSQTRKSVLGV